MNGSDLYSAVVTSVPFLLLALVADSKLFGPSTSSGGRRLEQIADGFFLLLLAVGFFSSLIALAMDDPPDLRAVAAVGFGMGAFGAFMHAIVHVVTLYRAVPEGSSE